MEVNMFVNQAFCNSNLLLSLVPKSRLVS